MCQSYANAQLAVINVNHANADTLIGEVQREDSFIVDDRKKFRACSFFYIN